MKVKELIEILKNVDQDREVILAMDSEGNGYSPLCSFWEGKYYEGECGFEALTESLIADGFSEDDIMEDGVPAIIFWS